ncbi:1-acyl-sn-glycerol-3-phosphate acyltransferase [Arachidicoccus rhizosphaerae]|uniref:1-acyl-sn-glycerol-3-phosphate acyltransferase n=1 Tax=Arachidicoccus rhizosphaerae TaxID=551991 RepID=A0A1H3ZU02_9BACT|nr:lysophospholipid acyltransferase family protein [Arachidicoccus rhizosphaerae]SEA27189.1 1-acyl-sn-glycerol-3-phosphate acyltransferase [Arachidicoccus rhizosphaerae]
MEQQHLKWYQEAFLWAYNAYALAGIVFMMVLLFPFGVLLLNRTVGVKLFYRICGCIARCWLWAVAVKLEWEYEAERDDWTDEPAIYIANHRSYIDVFLMLASMKGPYKPLGKDEMGRIPLFGWFYRRMTVTVDRGSAASRAKCYIDLNRALEEKTSVFVFPEGTFNESELPLKAFYKGPFQLAIKRGVSIRPVVFIDSVDRMHFNRALSLRPGVCRVMFLKEIQADGCMHMDANFLKETVYKRMESVLRKLNKRYAALI